MDEGLITLPSPLRADAAVARLRSEIEGRGLTIFGIIDHAAAARRAGLEMNAATVVIFGSPRSGTPLMRCAPTLAIDLPLRMLVWEDEAGGAWLTYNAPAWFMRRHAARGADVAEGRWEAEGGALEGPPESAAVVEAHHDLGSAAGPLVAGLTDVLAALAAATTRTELSA